MRNTRILLCLIVASLVSAGLNACANLDIEPTKNLRGDQVFTNEVGITADLATLYSNLPIAAHNADLWGGLRGGEYPFSIWNNPSMVTGETECIPLRVALTPKSCNGGMLSYWDYSAVRLCNLSIRDIIANKDKFAGEEDVYNHWLGEAYFCRAFIYFGMVRSYGGVPIVDKVQDPTAPMEELQVTRATEYDTWKFIYEDLKFAMDNGASDKSEVYRGNRYAAAALMAKAMLWAGCVAKYNQYTGITGPATDAGLMGMDPADAKEFFQYAYDACKFLHDAGFRLHTGADKEKAYTEIFIEDLAGEEDIFVKTFGTPNTVVPWNSSLYSSYDDMVLPKGTGMAQSVGAAIHATWDLVSLYETPAVVDADGYPVRFDSYDDFWNTDEMEPRCRANFFFSGMVEPVSGTKLDIQQGVFTTLAAKAADLTPEDNNFVAPNCIKLQDPGKTQDVGGFGNVKITGANGIKRNGDEGFSTTGIFVRKYMNYKADPATRQLHQSTQSWKVFRYGEILVDWAEAAYELGLETGNDALKAEAFEHVNEIRDRAGAHRHEMVASPADIGEELYGFPLDENLQYIRDERRRELCIENQGEWDQRRWRTAHSILASNYWPRTLMPYKVLNEDKYIFLNEVEVYGRRLSFDKRNYYEAIPGGEINKNPKLVRNDGY